MKYKQGKFTPINRNKYKGNVDDIVYRSALELRYFTWCDTNINVIKWSSEEVVINYYNPLDKKVHRYFVDLWMKIKDKNGKVKEFIAEIKPAIYTTQDHLYTKNGKLTKSTRLKLEWIKNQLKWKQAKEYAKKRGLEFIILTERDI